MENVKNQTNDNDADFGIATSAPIFSLNYSQVPIPEDVLRNHDPFYVIIPITCLYLLIFLAGIVGNISTCVVIARNRHMHTATNYYLFSLAISDLLLLISGLPSETVGFWSKHRYPFTEAFCLLNGFTAETSANATVLTITAFTIERYVAICHPFRSHTLSKLSRAVRLIFVIWVLAMLLAVPPAIQYGVIQVKDTLQNNLSYCSIKFLLFDNVFLVSTCVIFILPMSVITVLYVLIAMKLRTSVRMSAKRPSVSSDREASRSSNSTSQQHVIKMLVAVVVTFFICWAPFHAQRLWAMHLRSHPKANPFTIMFYNILKHISGILYFISTSVNPVLYNIMSKKFRLAFKLTLSHKCGKASPADKRSPCGTLRRSSQQRIIITPPSSCRRHDSVVVMTKSSTYSRKTQICQQKQQSEPSRSSYSGEAAISKSQVWEEHDNNNVINGRIADDRDEEKSQATSQSNLNAKPYVMSRLKSEQQRRAKTALSCIGKKFRRLPDSTRNLFCHNVNGRHSRNNNEVKDESQPCVKETLAKTLTISSSTISNSSLLDVDLSEFTTAELAKIVGQLKNGNGSIK